MKQPRKLEVGFSLPELLIAIAISTSVMVGLTSFMLSSSVSMKKTEMKIAAQQMSRDLAQLTFNSENCIDTFRDQAFSPDANGKQNVSLKLNGERLEKNANLSKQGFRIDDLFLRSIKQIGIPGPNGFPLYSADIVLDVQYLQPSATKLKPQQVGRVYLEVQGTTIRSCTSNRALPNVRKLTCEQMLGQYNDATQNCDMTPLANQINADARNQIDGILFGPYNAYVTNQININIASAMNAVRIQSIAAAKAHTDNSMGAVNANLNQNASAVRSNINTLNQAIATNVASLSNGVWNTTTQANYVYAAALTSYNTAMSAYNTAVASQQTASTANNIATNALNTAFNNQRSAASAQTTAYQMSSVAANAVNTAANSANIANNAQAIAEWSSNNAYGSFNYANVINNSAVNANTFGADAKANADNSANYSVAVSRNVASSISTAQQAAANASYAAGVAQSAAALADYAYNHPPVRNDHHATTIRFTPVATTGGWILRMPAHLNSVCSYLQATQSGTCTVNMICRNSSVCPADGQTATCTFPDRVGTPWNLSFQDRSRLPDDKGCVMGGIAPPITGTKRWTFGGGNPANPGPECGFNPDILNPQGNPECPNWGATCKFTQPDGNWFMMTCYD